MLIICIACLDSGLGLDRIDDDPFISFMLRDKGKFVRV